jgi:hypothetical protein
MTKPNFIISARAPGATSTDINDMVSMADAKLFEILEVTGDPDFDWLNSSYPSAEIAAEALYLAIGTQEHSVQIDAQDVCVRSDKGIADLCNTLTEAIHIDLEDYDKLDTDNLEATSDAFDAHAWAKVRAALYDVSPEMTGDKIMRLYAVNEEGHLTYAETAHQYLVKLDGDDPITFIEPEEAMQHMLNRQSEAICLRAVTMEQICEGQNMEALSEDLTDAVMDGIPDIDDDDARVDDFDNHPMSQLRDATMELEVPEADPEP